MTAQNKSTLQSNITTNVADNSSGDITAADIRTILTDITDSHINTVDNTVTAAGYALLDDASATAQRTTLGLGTAATSDTGDFAAATHNQAASTITTGTFDDARIAESNVTQHQAALSVTESQISDLSDYVESDPTGVTGADQITNMMSLTQAEYDAITPNASTFYVITG